MRQQANSTINQAASILVEGNQSSSKSFFREITKELRQLYFDKRYRGMHLTFKVMFMAMMNLYFLAMFNYSSLKGDVFTIGILFGLSEVLGVLVGEPLIAHFPDHIAMTCCLVMVMICSFLLKLPDLDNIQIYVYFLGQVFFIGMAFNLLFVMMETRTNPKHLNVAFEMLMCFSQGSTMLSPLLAKAPEPVPTITFISCCIVAILMIIKVGPLKSKPKSHNVL